MKTTRIYTYIPSFRYFFKKDKLDGMSADDRIAYNAMFVQEIKNGCMRYDVQKCLAKRYLLIMFSIEQ